MSNLTVTVRDTYTVRESYSTITITTMEAVTLTDAADTANPTIDNLNITGTNVFEVKSEHGGALENRLYVEGKIYAYNYLVDNDNTISIFGGTSTVNKSTVILTNGNIGTTLDGERFVNWFGA